MKKKTTEQLWVELLIGVDVIGAFAEVILIMMMNVVGGYIGVNSSMNPPYDPYFDGYRASVELFGYVFLAILISIFVVPLVVAPFVKLITRGLSRFKPMQTMTALKEYLGFRLCTIFTKMNKSVAYVLTGVAMIYMAVMVSISWRLVYCVENLNLQEKQLMMTLWAPKLCAYLWQSLIVLAVSVIAFFLLVWLYSELEAPMDCAECE